MMNKEMIKSNRIMPEDQTNNNTTNETEKKPDETEKKPDETEKKPEIKKKKKKKKSYKSVMKNLMKPSSKQTIPDSSNNFQNAKFKKIDKI